MIAAAIRAEFNRRRREGQVAVDAGRMARDTANRNLALWRDMVMWSQGQAPAGPVDFAGWAAAAITAAHKCAARLSARQGHHPQTPDPAAQTDSDTWCTESIAHAHALRAASIRLDSLARLNADLRSRAEAERAAA